MANNINIEARAALEHDFITTVFCGVVHNTIDPEDVFANCPIDMLQDGGFPRQVYESIYAVWKSGEHISIDTLYTYINKVFMSEKRNSIYPQITVNKLGEMLTSTLYGYAPEAIFHYIRLMRNEGVKRKVEQSLYSIISDCQKYGLDAADILNDIKKIHEDIEAICDDQENSSIVDLMDRVKQSILPSENNRILPLPYQNLNEILGGGIGAGELVILAARPGRGKTAFAGCVAVESARRGIPTLFISREVPDITLGQRLVAREMKFDVISFRQKANYGDYIYEAACQGADIISSLPLHIKEKSVKPITPTEIRRAARGIPNIGLIVIDYLQLLTPDTQRNIREREVADMSRAMKQLAIEMDCPVLLLSQLNRAGDQTNREPKLYDLRESGAIEQDADVVIFLHIKSEDEKAACMPVKAIVAKSRNSPTGEAFFIFNKSFCDFEEEKDGSYWVEQKKESENGWKL